MLDLYKLQIFSVVVQEGSFSAAAERLYITQSAISQHIKELEASFGRKLFERGWRGVELTAHGEVLYQYAGEIFALIARAENAVTDVDSLTGGKVNIGATPGIGIYLAPDWVQSFRTRHPQLTVGLQTGITSQIITDVLAGRLDIGFIEGELDQQQENHPRLRSLVLEDIEQQVIVGFKHPYWDKDHLTLQEMHQQSFIVRQAGSQSRIWLESTLSKHQIEPVIGAEFDNLESIKRAVTLGMCLTILPPYAVQQEVEQGLLHMIPVKDAPFRRSLKLIYEANTHFSPVTHAFLSHLSQRYASVAAVLNSA